MNTESRAVLLSCFSCALSWTPAHAGDLFDCISDTRRCTAAYSGNGSATTTTSRREPMEFFEGAADLDVFNGLESWLTYGDQRSGMDSSSMSFEGAGSVVTVATPLSPPLRALGQSKFDVWFTIESAAAYTLEGEVSEFGHAESLARVVLSRYEEGDPVIESITASEGSVERFARSGVLEPGTYRLRGEATAVGRTTPPEILSEAQCACRFEFRLSPAEDCGADWNRDGFTDSVDLFDFLQSFVAGDADFNADGRTDSDDLFDYLAAFLAGC